MRARYQAPLWIAVGLAGLGLITTVLFVKIKPAKSEVTVDEEGNSGETEMPRKKRTLR